ncbi:hypothetical protein [Kangiella sp. TOML190]|uniref:hypothetical protein n=1 Tax=Kangiella sp. TOML190 TaxID=2931351 RepID=UPI00203AE67A|nr:hypothetical protein [Kangiella sp. TOML190]
MKLLHLSKKSISKVVACAMLPVNLIANVQAAEKLKIDELGHLAYQQQGQAKKKIPVATSVVSRSLNGRTQVEVSQIFTHSGETNIQAEYFFPIPEASQLIDFQISNDLELTGDMPPKSVILKSNDQVTIMYQFITAEDNSYHASLMGFPAARSHDKSQDESHEQLRQNPLANKMIASR